MTSVQTLPPPQRRLVAAWAAACAEHVLPVFEVTVPGDDRPRVLIERARAYARGDLQAADGIRGRFSGGVGAGEVADPAAAAAARAAGQAAAVCHMGAHALGAAAWAAVAAALACPDQSRAARIEIEWQLARLSPATADALLLLPLAGEDRAGPLGPGLLTRGVVGGKLRELQALLAAHAGACAPGADEA